MYDTAYSVFGNFRHSSETIGKPLGKEKLPDSTEMPQSGVRSCNRVKHFDLCHFQMYDGTTESERHSGFSSFMWVNHSGIFVIRRTKWTYVKPVPMI